ncbi:hypothetical protein B0H19DRAFT_314765 [Mycena capillaripes]|nr:hypothetical protein B0H19DRAFT_314765 [Mycena capillaripes]
MSTQRKEWSSLPRYEATDSPSYSNESDTLLSHQRSASEPRYVYYRVYTLDGMIHCKKHEENMFIGRIRATSVPPHTLLTH